MSTEIGTSENIQSQDDVGDQDIAIFLASEVFG